MKGLFVAFLALAVSASALPQGYEVEERDQRIVAGQIRKAIEDLSQAIRDNNLDPLQINRLSIENEPQPGVAIKILIEGLNCAGLSDIVIDRVDYSAVTSRLRLNLAMPGLRCSLLNSLQEVNYHGVEYTSELSGEFQLTRLAVTLDLRINISIISGISIRSSDCTLTLGNINANVRIVLNGENYSSRVNNFINTWIPNWIRVNQAAINRIFSDLVKDIGNLILG